MAFTIPTYDTIFAGIITAYKGITGKVSITFEHIEFMLAAGYASAISGLYNLLSKVAKQISPQTATGDYLSQHAVSKGLARNIDESDSDLRARILDKERSAPASGNIKDFKVWALVSSTDVKRAYIYPASNSNMSLGNVGILILTNEEDEEPDSALLTLITDHITPLISAGMDKEDLLIASPVFDIQDVTMTITGLGIDLDAIKTKITDYIKTLMPGGSNELQEQRDIHESGQVKLTHTKLSSLAFEVDGVNDTNITEPFGDVTPDFQHIIRPGTITINAA